MADLIGDAEDVAVVFVSNGVRQLPNGQVEAIYAARVFGRGGAVEAYVGDNFGAPSRKADLVVPGPLDWAGWTQPEDSSRAWAPPFGYVLPEVSEKVARVKEGDLFVFFIRLNAEGLDPPRGWTVLTKITPADETEEASL